MERYITRFLLDLLVFQTRKDLYSRWTLSRKIITNQNAVKKAVERTWWSWFQTQTINKFKKTKIKDSQRNWKIKEKC